MLGSGRLAAPTLVGACIVAQAMARAPLAQASVLPHRIVLVSAAGHDAATSRVRAELESEGWQVIEVEPRNEPLGTTAGVESAVAAIRVQSHPPTVEIWVADPATGVTASDETLTGARDSDAVLAVRAVEVLRARLLKVGIVVPQPPRPPPPVSRPRVEPVPMPPRPASLHPWWLGAGPSVLVNPGGLGPAAGASLSLGTPVVGHWVIGLRLWVPTTAARLAAPEGETNVWFGSAALGVGWELSQLDARWSSRASLAGGAWFFHYSAEADPPYRARSSTLFTGTAFLAWDVGYRLAPRLALRLGPCLGLAFPRPVVRVLGHQTAQWGRPWLAFGFEAEFDLAPR